MSSTPKKITLDMLKIRLITILYELEEKGIDPKDVEVKVILNGEIAITPFWIDDNGNIKVNY